MCLKEKLQESVYECEQIFASLSSVCVRVCVCARVFVCVCVCVQNLIAEKCVPILHKLEQVSSDKHVGTLAENLLDALRGDPSAAQKVARSQHGSQIKHVYSQSDLKGKWPLV